MRTKIEHHVRQDGQIVEGIKVVDKTGSKKNPTRTLYKSFPQQRYAAGIISDIKIRENTIYSNGHLQGVFCSDGGIYNGTIKETTKSIPSQRTKSACVCFTGHIEK